MSDETATKSKMQRAREYFGSFSCERLTKRYQNKQLIRYFSSREYRTNLEEYLKEQAWEEDKAGENRVYLIKDQTGAVAFYFSLKCGLLVGEPGESRLPEAEREFIHNILVALEASDEQALERYRDLGIRRYGREQFQDFYKIAEHRSTAKSDAQLFGQDVRWNVDRCFSAIELAHFCRNEKYTKPADVEFPLGFGLFWEQIVPLILEISELVGCQYLYLFAAEDPEAAGEPQLVKYYKGVLKFYESYEDNLIIIKPRYDYNCPGLVQEISQLRTNREDVWKEYEEM